MRSDVTGPRPVVHHLERVMGTVVTIDIYCDEGRGDPEIPVALVRARKSLRDANGMGRIPL